MKYAYQYFVGLVLIAVIIFFLYTSKIQVCQAGEGPKKEPETPQAPHKEEERDPFQLSPLGGFSMQLGADRFAGWEPNIVLRGIVEVKGKPSIVLIDIDGDGVFLVRKGDQISLQQTANSISLSVHEINDSEVLIKIMPFDQIIPIR